MVNERATMLTSNRFWGGLANKLVRPKDVHGAANG